MFFPPFFLSFFLPEHQKTNINMLFAVQLARVATCQQLLESTAASPPITVARSCFYYNVVGTQEALLDTAGQDFWQSIAMC
jgi:hypothetical protein